MATFTESKLDFTFPADWIVRKFDDTVAYRSVSGHGLKGVDFICLAPAGELWLIEVKNYRKRGGGYRTVRRSPEGTGKHVGRKFADTKRLVKIVNRAMRNEWWTELRLRWYGWMVRARPDSLAWFWWEAERRLAEPRKLVCLLWMETPETSRDYEMAVNEALDEILEPGNRLLLAELDRPGSLPFTVRPQEL